MKDLIRQIQDNINKYPDVTIIVDQEESNYFHIGHLMSTHERSPQS